MSNKFQAAVQEYTDDGGVVRSEQARPNSRRRKLTRLEFDVGDLELQV